MSLASLQRSKSKSQRYPLKLYRGVYFSVFPRAFIGMGGEMNKKGKSGKRWGKGNGKGKWEEMGRGNGRKMEEKRGRAKEHGQEGREKGVRRKGEGKGK